MDFSISVFCLSEQNFRRSVVSQRNNSTPYKIRNRVSRRTFLQTFYPSTFYKSDVLQSPSHIPFCIKLSDTPPMPFVKTAKSFIIIFHVSFSVNKYCPQMRYLFYFMQKAFGMTQKGLSLNKAVIADFIACVVDFLQFLCYNLLVNK